MFKKTNKNKGLKHTDFPEGAGANDSEARPPQPFRPPGGQSVLLPGP